MRSARWTADRLRRTGEPSWHAFSRCAGLIGLLVASLITGACSSSTGGHFTSPALVSDDSTETSWEYAGAVGEIIQTENFQIHTTADTDTLRARFPIFMEAALAHYQRALGPLPAPNQTLQTYLFGDRPQWLTFTREIMGRRAEQYAGIRRGGFTTQARVVLWDIGLYDTLRIAAHEGWHQYTQATFRNRLPAWLEEGIATCMEGHRWSDDEQPEFTSWANPERFFTLRRAQYRKRLIPLNELLTIEPENLLGGSSRRVLSYYAQSWALIQFLNYGEDGKYREQLHRVLKDAAEGTLDRAVQSARREAARAGDDSGKLSRGILVCHAYFSTDLEALEKEYRAFIERLMTRQARGAVFRGEIPSGL